MDDFNALLGQKANTEGREHIIGKHTIGISDRHFSDPNSERFIDFCLLNNLVIANTFFKRPCKKIKLHAEIINSLMQKELQKTKTEKFRWTKYLKMHRPHTYLLQKQKMDWKRQSSQRIPNKLRPQSHNNKNETEVEKQKIRSQKKKKLNIHLLTEETNQQIYQNNIKNIQKQAKEEIKHK